MAEFRGVRRAWRLMLRRKDIERAVSEEMAFHMEMCVEQLIEEGLSPAEARAEARRRFGDRVRYRGECFEVGEKRRKARVRSDWIADLGLDMRYTIRQLRNSPGFTVATILCLAIGIGANTAIFNVAKFTLFPDTVIDDPDSIVRIYTRLPGGEEYASFSWPDYLDIRDRAQSFSSAATEAYQPFHFSTEGRPERVWGSMVTGNYFSTLGIDMALGRSFTPEEDATPGTHPVMVISYALWQSRFGGDPETIGREVLLNGHPFVIIGVADKAYRGGMVGVFADVWVPMMMHAQAMPDRESWDSRDSQWLLNVTARLKPGVTIEQASAEVEALMAQLEELYPETNSGITPITVSEKESRLHPYIRSQFKALLILVFAVIGLVLLLTCANVAGLLLARSSARRREIGIRLAVGAHRGRLVRLILTESVLLALIAGTAGLLLSQLLAPILRGLVPQIDLPLTFDIAFYWDALWFTLGVSLLAGVIFGLSPAMDISRQDIVTALSTARSTQEKRTHRSRQMLVAGQVTISLVLLIGAGLVIRSMSNARHIDPGFNPDNLVLAYIDLNLQGYEPDQGWEFWREVDTRLSKLPGVSGVTRAWLPQLMPTINTTAIVPEGWEGPADQPPSISYNFVDEDYFEVMEIPLLRGRAFTLEDDEDAPATIIVNQAFADRFWPGEDPVGRVVHQRFPDGPVRTIVGVVPTGKYFSLGEEPRPYLYYSANRTYTGDMSLHIRTEGDPAPTFEAIRREISLIDPALPITNLATMESSIDLMMLTSRLLAWVVTAFALMALLLCTIGLYGVIAFTVNQRTQEIGIRMALGARTGDVVRLIVGRTMIPVSVAIFIGLTAGLLLSTVVTQMLHGLESVDLLSTVGAMFVLLLTTFAASYLPALRATKVDPVQALASE